MSCILTFPYLGIIADLWGAEGRGPALNLFVGMLFMGPVMGPIVSG
jgi:MFS transporter, DHA1 family, multidrug resistance protein